MQSIDALAITIISLFCNSSGTSSKREKRDSAFIFQKQWLTSSNTHRRFFDCQALFIRTFYNPGLLM